MVNINMSVVIQIINFLVLIFIMNLVCYKPIRGILKQRRETIEGLEDAIETAIKKAEETNRAFAEGIREARARGQKEKEALIQAAAAEESKIIARINEQARAELEEVKKKISQDAEKVRQALQKEVDTFAEAISQKILGRAG